MNLAGKGEKCYFSAIAETIGSAEKIKGGKTMKNQGVKMYRNYDRVYVDLPQYPTIRRFICDAQKAIYINVGAEGHAKSVKVQEVCEDLPVVGMDG